MCTEPNQRPSYADLGKTWIRDQEARILQRHLQFGRRYQLDVDSLLSRAALASRVNMPHRIQREDFMRRVTSEAIEHCLRLDAANPTLVLVSNVA